MLSVTAVLLSVLLSALGQELVPEGCPSLDFPDDLVSQVVGAPVTLRCMDRVLQNNASIHWTLEDKPITPELGRREIVEGKLILKSVQHSDSGNYSCYLEGHKQRSLFLLLVDPLEEPVFSCHRKSFFSSIQCEWSPLKKPLPNTEAILLVTQFRRKDKTFQRPCHYLPGSQKFSCSFNLGEDDNSLYLIMICVTNGAVRKSSKGYLFRGYETLQPDPPVDITVRAIDRSPHRLKVTWKDPPSWNSTFYRLQFELRYRSEKSKTYTIIQEKQHYQLIISDALIGTKHTVQMRAREEFNNGRWSEWSKEVTGTPWTETKSSEVEKKLVISTQVPTTPDNYSKKHSPEDPESISNTQPVPGSTHLSYTFLLSGGSLVLGMALFIAIIMRYRKKSKLTTLKEGKPNMLPPHSLDQVPEKPQSTTVLVPLISPSVSASSSEPTNIPVHSGKNIVNPQSLYDITNRDYFFPR